MESKNGHVKNLLVMLRLLNETDHIFATRQDLKTISKFMEEDEAKIAKLREPVDGESKMQKARREKKVEVFERELLTVYRAKQKELHDKNPTVQQLYETKVEILRNLWMSLPLKEREKLGGRKKLVGDLFQFDVLIFFFSYRTCEVCADGPRSSSCDKLSQPLPS